jgi:GNAT superfamily N-acetyltransferase
MTPDDRITIPGAPEIPGLNFRPFRGPEDFPGMAAVVNRYNAAVEEDQFDTVESLAEEYAHLVRSDPYRDMIVAEIDGRLVGYMRGWWYQEQDGGLIYGANAFIEPARLGQGIERAMLRWIEGRQREIAAGYPDGCPKAFQRFISEKETALIALLESEGYTPARYTFSMVRPSLDDIPDFPLPAGIELRPARPEHYRLIWEADLEAFRDHWGVATLSEADYEAWQADMVIFQPELWQIAWDVATDEIAGQVRTFIDWEGNKAKHRARGYTEFISVRRPWRRRGLARALIAESLRVQRMVGMTESELGVDSENLTGATRVYEDCGFRVVARNMIYRKSL